MTTLTTVLALLPLAIGTGDAAALRAPMAATLLGGLLASTLGSLLVLPCLALILERLRPGNFVSGSSSPSAEQGKSEGIGPH